MADAKTFNYGCWLSGAAFLFLQKEEKERQEQKTSILAPVGLTEIDPTAHRPTGFQQKRLGSWGWALTCSWLLCAALYLCTAFWVAQTFLRLSFRESVPAFCRGAAAATSARFSQRTAPGGSNENGRIFPLFPGLAACSS